MLPIIIGLISLSLLGILFIQISYLKNVTLLRKDQVRQKIIQVTNNVGEELSLYKGTPATPNKVIPGFGDDFRFELTKPYNVGHRFTAQEIYEKIKVAFATQGMENIQFEFGLITNNRGIERMERQSSNFVEWYEDTLNHYNSLVPLIPPSGSAAENFSSDEILIVVVPKIEKIVTKDLLPQMIFSIVLLLVIITAFYLTVSTMIRQKK